MSILADTLDADRPFRYRGLHTPAGRPDRYTPPTPKTARLRVDEVQARTSRLRTAGHVAALPARALCRTCGSPVVDGWCVSSVCGTKQ